MTTYIRRNGIIYYCPNGVEPAKAAVKAEPKEAKKESKAKKSK